MEPFSPSSPHSPVKAMVDKIYYAKQDSEGALPTNPSKKTFLFQPKSFYVEGDEKENSDMRTEITDLSPTKIRANRDNAVNHFRQARHANARYAAYKKEEDKKKSAVRSKSESALTTKKMQAAANKLMAIQALAGKGGGGGSAFLQKVTAARLAREAKGEKLEVNMRVTEAASSSALVVGRR